MTELESLTTTSDEHTHKLQESYGNKLKTLESQVRYKFTAISSQTRTLIYEYASGINLWFCFDP